MQIVIILGMHRCGTSLLANFLNSIGVDFGNNFGQSDEWNEEGYWENSAIVQTHEKIFSELNCKWNDLRVSLQPDWCREPKIQELKRELIETVRLETGKAKGIWGFKDPRTAILLPLWREIFEELQLEPIFILAVRRPASVAASLSKRDGLSFSHSQLLWLKTNLDALSYTRNSLSAVIDYDRWFESGFEQARSLVNSIGLPWPVSDTKITEALSSIIRPRLRHNHGAQREECSTIVERLFSLLLETASTGKISNEIWEIAETIEKASGVLELWSNMVSERDKVSTDFKKLARKRKKTLQISYAVVAILVVALVYSFAGF